jgi:hypothetical protein
MLRSCATGRWIAAVLLAALATGCGGKSGSPADSPRRGGGDSSALQGTWEQLPEQGPAASPKQRVVKQVSGDTETVTTHGPDGKVLSAHTAKFKLARRGDVPVYTFYDRRITAGPEQGRSEAAPRSYVYRLRGDEFDEVWGLLPGQEQREVVVKHWKRAGSSR